MQIINIHREIMTASKTKYYYHKIRRVQCPSIYTYHKTHSSLLNISVTIYLKFIYTFKSKHKVNDF